MVTQIVNVAKQTVVKNKIIKSPRIAVIDLTKDDTESNPGSNGVVTFTLPKADRDGKDLQGCEVGSGSGDTEEEREDTILLVSILLVLNFTLLLKYLVLIVHCSPRYSSC